MNFNPGERRFVTTAEIHFNPLHHPDSSPEEQIDVVPGQGSLSSFPHPTFQKEAPLGLEDCILSLS